MYVINYIKISGSNPPINRQRLQAEQKMKIITIKSNSRSFSRHIPKISEPGKFANERICKQYS